MSSFAMGSEAAGSRGGSCAEVAAAPQVAPAGWRVGRVARRQGRGPGTEDQFDLEILSTWVGEAAGDFQLTLQVGWQQLVTIPTALSSARETII